MASLHPQEPGTPSSPILSQELAEGRPYAEIAISMFLGLSVKFVVVIQAGAERSYVEKLVIFSRAPDPRQGIVTLTPAQLLDHLPRTLGYRLDVCAEIEVAEHDTDING